MAKFIGNKNFVIGYPTLADFKLAEASYYFEQLYKNQYKEYEFLTRIRNNVENLKEIKKYQESDKYQKMAFLPTYAQLKF
jgi:uncharacterized membrane protein YiaA